MMTSPRSEEATSQAPGSCAEATPVSRTPQPQGLGAQRCLPLGPSSCELLAKQNPYGLSGKTQRELDELRPGLLSALQLASKHLDTNVSCWTCNAPRLQVSLAVEHSSWAVIPQEHPASSLCYLTSKSLAGISERTVRRGRSLTLLRQSLGGLIAETTTSLSRQGTSEFWTPLNGSEPRAFRIRGYQKG